VLSQPGKGADRRELELRRWLIAERAAKAREVAKLIVRNTVEATGPEAIMHRQPYGRSVPARTDGSCR